jgi:hypothetical protein
MANMKAAFHAINARLKSKKRHMALIGLGPSFEGWANAEMGVILTRELSGSRGEYLHGEKTKRDLVICRADGKAGWVIEVKLVYPWRRSKMTVPLERLCLQVEGRSRHYKDEDLRTRRSGIVFGVWISPPEESGYWDPKLKTASQFFKRLRECVLEQFDEDGFAIQHRNFYRPVSRVRVQGRTVTIGMTYVTLRRS